jgi:hypothetical protein
VLTIELYAKYKQHYTDDEICKIADCTRKELKAFKEHHRILMPSMIPDHLLKKAKALDIHPDTVLWRMKNKRWTMYDACTTPKETPVLTKEQFDEAKSKYGLHPSTIYRRMERGMSMEEALTTPNTHHKRKSLQRFMQELTMSELMERFQETGEDVSVYEFIEDLRKS